MTGRIVLAYSGGLDGSVAIPYLAEQHQAEIITATIDVGSGDDHEVIRRRAIACGAAEAIVVDAREEFINDYCAPAILANAIYMGYPLASALARPLMVKHLAQIARDVGATAVAHGATGKGNDQVRFETGFRSLNPELSVLAPTRDSNWTRDEAIAYAEKRCLPIDVSSRSPFSIDQNPWGRAIENGFIEDMWEAPTEELFGYTSDPSVPREPDQVIITFHQGLPVAVDGRSQTLPDIVREINRRAGKQGVGRVDVIEDRLVGIKSRELYEAPAAVTLLTAHQEIENVTLERDQAHFKRSVDRRWGELVYQGLWFSPLMRSLNAFILDSQSSVSGDIRLTLHAGRAVVTGRRSETSLYDYGLATYHVGDKFDHTLAKGFVRLWGLPSSVAAIRDRKHDGGQPKESAS